MTWHATALRNSPVLKGVEYGGETPGTPKGNIKADGASRLC
jgi:hypothetical protein